MDAKEKKILTFVDLCYNCIISSSLIVHRFYNYPGLTCTKLGNILPGTWADL